MKFTDKFTGSIPSSGPGKLDDNGFLRLNKVRLGRTGIQRYQGKELPEHLGFAPGEMVNVYRPEEEVFSAESMASLEGVPVTVEHEWKTTDNNDSVGSLSGIPTRDDGDIVGKLLVTEKGAIVDIKKKNLSDISLGYQADVTRESGNFKGEPYQAVQRNIRYNHVALLRPGTGRAGDKIKIEDKKTMDLVTIGTDYGDIQVDPGSRGNLKRFMDAAASDKKEKEEMADEKPAFLKKILAAKEEKKKLTDAEKENETLKGENASLKKQLDAAKDPKEIEKAASELSKVKDSAKALMGDKMPQDLSALDLKKAVAKHYADALGMTMDSAATDDYMLGIYNVAVSSIGDDKNTVVGHHIIDKKTTVDHRQAYIKDLKGEK